MREKDDSLLGESAVLPEWMANIEMAGIWKKPTREIMRRFSEEANLTKIYVWEILTGRSVPNEEQAKRIVAACQPFIEERKKLGLIKDIPE